MEDLLHDGDVPIMEDIGEEVDIVIPGPRVGEHIEGGGLDTVGEVAAVDGLGGDLIDRGFFQDSGGEVREV